MLIMLSGQGWDFLITPVLIGAIAIVLVGQGMQRLVKQWVRLWHRANGTIFDICTGEVNFREAVLPVRIKNAKFTIDLKLT